MGLVAATPEQVFRVVARVEDYGRFMKRVSATRILRRDARSYDFFYRITLPWPLTDLWCVTRNVHEEDHKRQLFRRRWRLLRGTFHRNRGSWRTSPLAGQTLLIYRSTLRPRMSLPGFVLDHVAKVALPRSIKTMRERVLQLKRQKKL